MQKLSDNTGSNIHSNTQNAGWDIGTNDKDAIKDKIARANSASLLELFARYEIPIDGYASKKCCCPLPDHNDNSPSFFFKTENQTFYCYGCGRGGKAVRLVSLMENVSLEEAADKIIEGYETNPDVVSNNGREFRERKAIVLGFSSIIRAFLQENSDDVNAIAYADKIAKGFDTLTEKHEIQNDGLKKVVEKLKMKLGEYKI